jgi:hypothetical protein
MYQRSRLDVRADQIINLGVIVFFKGNVFVSCAGENNFFLHEELN